MNYIEILRGEGELLPIYDLIRQCLEDLNRLPFLIEPIYREALSMEGEAPDQLRFALIRLQIYADIHRYEDMEQTQKIKYISQVLEKIIFGSLMLEQENAGID
jgi:hypothetical protein